MVQDYCSRIANHPPHCCSRFPMAMINFIMAVSFPPSFSTVIVALAVFCWALSIPEPTSAFVLENPRYQPSLNKKRGRSSSLASTWSDSKAVQDYQNFLATGKQEIELKKDQPSIIITQDASPPCELAEALLTMGYGDDILITPGGELPPALDGSAEYPIYVTLPPSQIAGFIKYMPDSYKDRVDDMVFFSGGLSYGNIEDVLKTYGLCRDSMTQVLLSGLRFTAAKRVQDVSVQLGTGVCAACGKWNGAMADRLKQNNDPSRLIEMANMEFEGT